MARSRSLPASSRAAPSSRCAGRNTGAEGTRGGAGVDGSIFSDDIRQRPRCPTTAKVTSGALHSAVDTLSWPIENLGPSLPTLLATVAGNLFELRQCHRPAAARSSACRQPSRAPIRAPLRRRRHPPADRRATRSGHRHDYKAERRSRPGRDGALVRELCAGGIDFIKDDELQADGPPARSTSGSRAVMRVINAHADRTGKKIMYAFNLTGDLDQMRRRHDLLLAEGGTCVMASLNSVGLVGMIELAPPCPAADPCPPQRLGLSDAASAAGLVLCRLAEDLAACRRRPHACQRPRNKFSETDDSVIALARARACRRCSPTNRASSCRCSPPARRDGRPPAPLRASAPTDLIYDCRRRHHGTSGRSRRRGAGPARRLGGGGGRRAARRLCAPAQGVGTGTGAAA